jgi:hypothetical protein
VNDFENPAEVPLAGVQKFHEAAPGQPSGLNPDVFPYDVLREPVAEVEGFGLVDPDLARLDFFMPQLSHLQVSEGPDDAAVQGRQVCRCKCAEKTAFQGRSMNIGKRAGSGVLDVEDFGILRIVGAVVHEGFHEQAVGNRNDFILIQRHANTPEIQAFPFGSQLVSTDIALIEDGPINPAFA